MKIDGKEYEKVDDHPVVQLIMESVKKKDDHIRKLEYTLKHKDNQIDDLIGALGLLRGAIECGTGRSLHPEKTLGKEPL